jgi:hypothetical protein
MMAIVALAFTSCKKEVQKTTKPTTAIFTITAQDLVDGNVNENRAYFDPTSLKIMFDQGDMVMIFNIDEEVPTNSQCAQYAAVQDGNCVTLQNCGFGEVAENVRNAYYAFYPSGPGHIQCEFYQGENKARFYVSPTQKYRPNRVPLEAMYMAAKVDNVEHLAQTETPETAFFFRNICGVYDMMLFDPNGPTVIKEIKITDNSFNLSGWVEVILPEVDPVEMQSLFNNYDPSDPSYMQSLSQYIDRVGFNVTEQGNTLTLTMPEEGVQIGTTQATCTHFYMVLRPLALTYGYTIDIKFADGSTKTIDLSDRNHQVAPNVIKHYGFNLANY